MDYYLDINTKLPFGKYKGQTPKEMLQCGNRQHYPKYEYLRWLKNSCNNVTMSKELLEEMQKYADYIFIGNSANTGYYDNGAVENYEFYDRSEGY